MPHGKRKLHREEGRGSAFALLYRAHTSTTVVEAEFRLQREHQVRRLQFVAPKCSYSLSLPSLSLLEQNLNVIIVAKPVVSHLGT